MIIRIDQNTIKDDITPKEAALIAVLMSILVNPNNDADTRKALTNDFPDEVLRHVELTESEDDD